MAGKLEERVKDIIVEQLGVNAEQVTPEASFIDDLGADSLDSVELIMAFEEEFGAAIPEEDAESLTTVGKVVDYLHHRRQGRRLSQVEGLRRRRLRSREVTRALLALGHRTWKLRFPRPLLFWYNMPPI